MKKYILSALCALALIACAKSDEDMVAVPATAPETIYASFEEPTTRTYVEQDKYLRWHAEDEISFFSTTYNLQYRFQGNTGDNNGSFTKITTDLVTGNALANNYAVYPYAASTAISDEGVISVTLPATQAYAENSFGRGANTMVAATNGTMDNVLRFKNAGGYLKLQLYGTDVTVKSVALQGNKGEKIAGEAIITATYGNDPVVTMADTATDVVTIDCGEGVTLSNDATTPTTFWFVLPETTFAEGFTVTVTDTEGGTFVKSTSNSFTIDRNMIQPMKSLEAVIEPAGPANNEIWYTTSDGASAGVSTGQFTGVTSNLYDNEKELWVITFKEPITILPKRAFSQKYTLTSVTLPKSITGIEDSAFYYCKNLSNIKLHHGITSVGHSAFYQCESITSIDIPSSMKEIQGQAFMYCTSLEKIVIPESVELVDGSAFYGCSGLLSVEVNSRSIGASAFHSCSKLQTIIIGENVQSFHDYGGAFYGCNKVTDIYCKPIIPPLICVYANGSDCDFPNKSVGYTIYVPRSAYDTYTQWSSIQAAYASRQNWSFYEDLIQPYDFD